MVFLFRLGYYVQKYFIDVFALSSIGYYLFYSYNDISSFFVNISFYLLFKQTQALLKQIKIPDSSDVDETLPYEY